MAKGRMIDRKIRSSESFAKLTYRQRDLWQGLIEVADDQGRLPGHPAKVRSLVWGYDDIATSEVNADLSVLEKAGNIMRYSKNGSDYIQLVNWHTYQEGAAWLGPSDYPAPDGWQDRCRYHGKNNEIITLNWNELPSNIPSKLPSELPNKPPIPLPGRDIEGDINSDSEGEQIRNAIFDQLRIDLEMMTGIPAPPQAIPAIQEIASMGANPEDIQAGYKWLITRTPMKYYSQLVGPTRTAMGMRIQRQNDHPPNFVLYNGEWTDPRNIPTEEA